MSSPNEPPPPGSNADTSPESTRPLGARVAARLADLPESPGVYLYRNAAGEVIYVGKAISLRSRVRSYFQKGASHTPKTRALVSEIEDLEIILAGSEVEALLLENNLIKKNRPRFNVVLRDDKNYPYLKLTIRDEYPRVGLVRKARLDGNLYFGPYLPSSLAWRTLRMIPKFFRVAICQVKFDGKQRPCLYYHLGQCLAPCAGYTNPGEYGAAVAEARMFLEGRSRELAALLEARMQAASEAQSYELAAHYRDLIASMKRLSERQGVSSVGLDDQDFFSLHREGTQAALQIFQMREGRVQARREFFFETVEEPSAELLRAAILQYYDAETALPRAILLGEMPAEAELRRAWLSEKAGVAVSLAVPQRGSRKRLLDLVTRNAKLAFDFRFRQDHTHGVAVLGELRDLLGLDEPPYRIECFDISHIQGTDQVASMVAWEGGKPRKSDYRRFKIKTVEGADDFRSIAEVVGRRYARLQAEGKKLPDLVLIDGGKGQLSSAVAALDALGLGDLPVASIAKREEEIFLEGRGEPIRLPLSSPVLQLVQRIRDEAHRFAITFHRSLRSKRTIRTELTEIPGIGAKTAAALLKEFGSVQALREAVQGPEDLSGRLGKRVATALARHFQ
jgi:excinuclease ABC subunit C